MLERDSRRCLSANRPLAIRLAAAACILALSVGTLACASSGSGGDGKAAQESSEEGRIEPRYQPREPVEEPWYNSDYLFGMTRAVTNSTIHPGAQVPLLVLTIPLDIVFLPFSAIGGFF
jgi:hypothetical protein